MADELIAPPHDDVKKQKARARKRAWRKTEAGRIAHRAEEKKRRDKNPEKFRELAKAWAARPRSKLLKNAASQRWRDANRELFREMCRNAMRRRRAEHPEKERLAYAQYRENNREIFRAKDRRNYHAKMQVLRQSPTDLAFFKALKRPYKTKWKIANKDKMVIYDNNRRARVRGAIGKISAEDVTAIHKAQRGRCAICSVKLTPTFHRDHITPLALGGSNRRNNIQLTCGPCNMAKGARDPIVFMQQMGRLL